MVQSKAFFNEILMLRSEVLASDPSIVVQVISIIVKRFSYWGYLERQS